MLLKSLSVSNFRNFVESTYQFHPFLTLVVGENSVGKTNLLEAIYFTQHGSGFRESKSQELIRTRQLQGYAESILSDEKTTDKLRIFLTLKDTVVAKQYMVNKVKKMQFTYRPFTQPTVIFSPAMLYVIDGEPERRRTFFDRILSQLDIEYKKTLLHYEQALRRRNKVLQQEENVEKLESALIFWDETLVKQARYIHKKRTELIDYFNSKSTLDEKTFSIQYKPNILTHETLLSSFQKQLYVRKTVVGPHRDEYVFFIKKDDELESIHAFGSRSEQRLTLFWLLLCEIELIFEKTKKRPILLLDDIFSELDIINKAYVLKLIQNYQTILTSADPTLIDIIEIPHSLITLP